MSSRAGRCSQYVDIPRPRAGPSLRDLGRGFQCLEDCNHDYDGPYWNDGSNVR